MDDVKHLKDAFFTEVTAAAQERPQAAGVEVEVELRAGHAAELITRHAHERRADLIVVGHKGHFLNDYLLGSTADRVAHHARCPVMIVK